MSEEPFSYRGYSFVIQKEDSGQLKVFRKLKKGMVELHGQKAYSVAKAYKLKVEKEPSLRKPRLLAKRAKKKKY